MKLIPALLLSLCLAIAGPLAFADGLEAELFPPEFLFSQREAIGLSTAQLDSMEAVLKASQNEFEHRKAALDERAKALQAELHQANPDPAKAEEKLRALLAQESEVKLLHMLTMLKVRALLTPDQLAKTRQLYAETAERVAQEGQRNRIQAKLGQLRDTVKKLSEAGTLPQETMERAQAIQELLKNGKEPEAEQQIDALLGQLSAVKPKS